MEQNNGKRIPMTLQELEEARKSSKVKDQRFVYQARLSEEEYIALSQMAMEDKMSRSKFIIKLIMDEYHKRGF